MNTKYDRTIFANRLSECLEEADMKGYQLAEHLHLTPGTISKYLAAEMSPKVTAIIAMAELFSVRSMWLMGIDDEKYDENKPTYKQIPILGRIAAGKPPERGGRRHGVRVCAGIFTGGLCPPSPR